MAATTHSSDSRATSKDRRVRNRWWRNAIHRETLNVIAGRRGIFSKEDVQPPHIMGWQPRTRKLNHTVV